MGSEAGPIDALQQVIGSSALSAHYRQLLLPGTVERGFGACVNCLVACYDPSVSSSSFSSSSSSSSAYFAVQTPTRQEWSP
nr:unnamed protein product [Spirometra erinaceieuropaei]